MKHWTAEIYVTSVGSGAYTWEASLYDKFPYGRQTFVGVLTKKRTYEFIAYAYRAAERAVGRLPATITHAEYRTPMESIDLLRK